MASHTDGYWSRSKELLTAPKGWFKPLLVMAAAYMVPAVGAFGVDGYALEWGRLTAWGVDAEPKQRGVDVGACIGTGARAFVVALGYLLVMSLVNSVLTTILGDSLGGLLGWVVSLFGGMLIVIAKLRATIYQSIGAGYQVDRIADMVKRDSNGFMRVLGLSAAMGAILGVLISAIIVLAIVANAGDFINLIYMAEDGTYVSDYDIVLAVFGIIAKMLPLLFVLGYGVSVLYMFVKLIETTAVALWVRQFNVQAWGNSSDPLPTDMPGSTAYDARTEPDAAPTYQQPVAQEPAQAWTPVPTIIDPATSVSGGTTESADEVASFDLTAYEPGAAASSEQATGDNYLMTTSESMSLENPAPFTLDVVTNEQRVDVVPPETDDAAVLPEEPPYEAPVASEPFTLDVPSEPVAEVAPQPAATPEPFEGPVENDEDARRALASLELPVRPFDHVVGVPAEQEAVDDAPVVISPEEPQAEDVVPVIVPELVTSADDGDVPTFTLDDVVAEAIDDVPTPTTEETPSLLESLVPEEPEASAVDDETIVEVIDLTGDVSEDDAHEDGEA